MVLLPTVSGIAPDADPDAVVSPKIVIVAAGSTLVGVMGNEFTALFTVSL